MRATHLSKRKVKFPIVVCLFLLAASALFLYTRVARPRTQSDVHTILLDSIHAHNYTAVGLEPGNHDYHSLFGLKDVIDYLERSGLRLHEATEGVVDERTLAGVDTLFINLVSDNLPPFLVEEISAVRAFVAQGGNLLVITDHSNCYHHSHKLAPLFSVLGIKLYNESALEAPPRTAGPGPGWIIIDHFLDHPITRGLAAISFHAGGTVDSRGAVATLSENGWGDLWATTDYGEGALDAGNRGNYGNFERDENERKGKLGVVLARQVGAGKVVVVGDQNIFGNIWLRYADNYKLLLNILSWFAGDEALRSRSRFIESLPARVLLLEHYAHARFGDYGDQGFYHAFCELGRYFTPFARATIDHDYDLVIIPELDVDLGDAELAGLRAHLREGRSLLFFGHEGQLGDRNRRLHAQLVDGLALKDRRETPDRIDYEYDGAGAVVVYRYGEHFGNAALNPPSVPPEGEQFGRAAELVGLVRSLLPRASR